MIKRHDWKVKEVPDQKSTWVSKKRFRILMPIKYYVVISPQKWKISGLSIQKIVGCILFEVGQGIIFSELNCLITCRVKYR
ncbi:hypothetical protein TW81_18635 [Vibrio galatheae]|uniref:Uncharacterized protein n=1 Tax=Vibrio galatheae TaxID=579748 RepID=A0A0F4NDY6_9VIBR|nr:hypothetical protein TW81_18635 [Vibrio galatheae]